MNSFKIESKDSGQRLDKYISRVISYAPKSFIYKSLRNKDIRLNGKKAEGNEILNTGDTVLFRFPDIQFKELSGNNEKSRTDVHDGRNFGSDGPEISKYCRIVFEDDDIIIADKKSGILSQKGVPDDISLNEVLLSYAGGGDEMFTPSVCNRLDRNTSGLITFAKTYKGARELNGLFKDREVEKYYLALVLGEVKEPAHVYGTYSKNESDNVVKISITEPESGFETETSYEPLEVKVIKGKKVTLLKVRLHTGKTHQIRATLSALGYPIIGDHKYGTGESSKLAKRLMLHSYQMIIPGRGTFTAENNDFL